MEISNGINGPITRTQDFQDEAIIRADEVLRIVVKHRPSLSGKCAGSVPGSRIDEIPRVNRVLMVVAIAPAPALYWYPYHVIGTATITKTMIRIFQLGITATALQAATLDTGRIAVGTDIEI